MKKIKQKHLIPNDLTMTEDKYVKIAILNHSRVVFQKVSKNTGIKTIHFTKFFDQTFKVEDYRNKQLEEFTDTIFEKVIKPVLEKNGIKVIK